MDKRELEITAELAHIELSDSEIGKFAGAVEQMIEYFDMMIDVSDELPADRPRKAVIRKDSAVYLRMSDEILDQAPELEDRFIVIPNVL